MCRFIHSGRIHIHKNTHTHNLTHTHTHWAQYLATGSKNISPGEKVEKYWPCVVEEQRGQDGGVTAKPSLSPLGFYRTLTTERQVCSVVFAIWPLLSNTDTHKSTHTQKTYGRQSHTTRWLHLLNTCRDVSAAFHVLFYFLKQNWCD